jgi:hypothetical protein
MMSSKTPPKMPLEVLEEKNVLLLGLRTPKKVRAYIRRFFVFFFSY